MREDEDLKRIRQKKLREIIKKVSERNPQKNVSTSNKPVELNDATFAETVRNHPFVVVDCWAPWCGPCNVVAPIIEKMVQDYAGTVLFGKLNVDENRMIAMQYQIMSIPTILVFKDGKLVDRIVGAMPRQMLEPKITRYLYC